MDTPTYCNIEAIEITNDIVGHVFLTIFDTSEPLWYGPYQGGKLSVYKAFVEGEPKGIFLPLIYVMTGVVHTKHEYVGYACYGPECDVTTAVNALLADIHDTVLRVTMAQKASDVPTIH